MKTLITPSEVMSIAFGTTHTLHDEAIPTHSILAAQQRLLRPALGSALYDQLVGSVDGGKEAHLGAFVADYLKTPLALYVASRLLPTIAAKVGSVGVVTLSSSGMEPVEKQTLRRVCRRLRADADALMDVATDYLVQHRDLFPLYDPHEDVRKRVGLRGGMVI